MKKITIILVTLLCSGFVFATGPAGKGREEAKEKKPVEYQKRQLKIGSHLGIEHPYSAGVELSLLYDEHFDVNAGIGFGLSGAKIGIGARYFPLREYELSPFLGANLYAASGLGKVNVYMADAEATYKFTGDVALLLTTGLRYRINQGHYLMGSIGYSIPFRGDKAQYLYGSHDQYINNFADSFCTGGFSISVGFLLKISKGHFRID